jgi:hypothetical protein
LSRGGGCGSAHGLLRLCTYVTRLQRRWSKPAQLVLCWQQRQSSLVLGAGQVSSMGEVCVVCGVSGLRGGGCVLVRSACGGLCAGEQCWRAILQLRRSKTLQACCVFMATTPGCPRRWAQAWSAVWRRLCWFGIVCSFRAISGRCAGTCCNRLGALATLPGCG